MKWAILVALLAGCGDAPLRVECTSDPYTVNDLGDWCSFGGTCADGLMMRVEADSDAVTCHVQGHGAVSSALPSTMPGICARADNPADEKLIRWLTKLCGDRSN
jgi:hypothetical protein